MPKVSVIVPVYGVEKFIERCARSLLEQTLDDIEFVFVDDCTPDASISILKDIIKDYPQRESQVKIQKMPQNSGLAAVRKYGVSIATGVYLIACDSDDYVEKEMYQEMYELAIKDELDLVQCDIDIVSDEGLIFSLTTAKQDISSEELRTDIIDGNIANSLCNKLIRREIYNNEEIHFPIAAMDEDNTMSAQLAYLCTKLGYIRKPFYKAYQNSASISRVPGEQQVLKRFEESLLNCMIVIDFLKSHGYDDDSVAILKAKVRTKNNLLPIVNNPNYKKLWKKTFPEVNKKVLFDSRITNRVKIKCLLVILGLYPLFNKLVR
ncbi:MAG: glycosyltransferase [Paludibacter sp.]|nr:glycosyltransferase [Paludibacter sp.]